MSLESISISGIMTRDVKTGTEDQSINAACKIMHDSNIGSIVIVKKNDNTQNETATGIITERDIVRIMGSLNPSLLHRPIGELMSKPLITMSAKNTIKDALQIMLQKNIRRVVVVEKEKMTGIITNKDIFRAIMNNQTLIPSLLHDEMLVGHKNTVHDQFGEYWFSDIMHRK